MSRDAPLFAASALRVIIMMRSAPLAAVDDIEESVAFAVSLLAASRRCTGRNAALANAW